MKAFIFILEAEYHANRTEVCIKEMKESKKLETINRLKERYNVRKWKDTKDLKGNYIMDENDDELDIIDIRSSLNRR